MGLGKNDHRVDAFIHAIPLEMQSKEYLIKELRESYKARNILEVSNKTINNTNQRLEYEIGRLKSVIKYIKSHDLIKKNKKLKKKIGKLRKCVSYWMNLTSDQHEMDLEYNQMAKYYQKMQNEIYNMINKTSPIYEELRLLKQNPDQKQKTINNLENKLSQLEKRNKKLTKSTTTINYDRDRNVATIQCKCGRVSSIEGISFDRSFRLSCSICGDSEFNYHVRDYDKYISLERAYATMRTCRDELNNKLKSLQDKTTTLDQFKKYSNNEMETLRIDLNNYINIAFHHPTDEEFKRIKRVNCSKFRNPMIGIRCSKCFRSIMKGREITHTRGFGLDLRPYFLCKECSEELD